MTNKQRADILKALGKQPMMGNKRAFAEAGVRMTKNQIAATLEDDPEFADDLAIARGVDPDVLEYPLVLVAKDPEHKHWPTAIRLVMQARHPSYGDKTRLELTGADGGPMEVTNPDVVAAAERFAALTDAAVRRAGTDGEDGATTDPQ